MVLLLSCFAGSGQNQRNDHHGGDQKDILAEDQKADGSGCYTGDGGNVVFVAEPLLYKDGDEQGCQNKFDAFVVDGDQRTGNRSQNGTGNPVDLIEQGNQKAVAMAGDAIRCTVLGDQGVGLVGQRENQIGLLLACSFIGIHHGDAVKQVAGIDGQGRQRSRQQTGPAGKETDSHILHGSGIDKEAHGCGPENTVSVLVQQDTEAEAEKQITGHNGDGIQKCGTDSFFLHRDPFLFELP